MVSTGCIAIIGSCRLVLAGAGARVEPGELRTFLARYAATIPRTTLR